MQGCEECGFRYADLDRTVVPAAVRSYPERYAAAIRHAEADAVRIRPAAGRWSALEYACHVRDVLAVQHDRLKLALVEDTPTFTPMGREQRVVEDRYNQQHPDTVLAELAGAADRLAAAFAGLDEAGWRRTGIYNWPEPTERNMLWVARHTVHELAHHLEDIDDGLEHIRVPSLDGRRFAARSDVDGGEVGLDAVFDYHQDGDLIWADYTGGAVRRGYLVGTRTGDETDFRYVQVNHDGKTASGHCHWELALTDDGRLRMHETWQWESRDGSGTSVVEELPHPER